MDRLTAMDHPVASRMRRRTDGQDRAKSLMWANARKVEAQRKLTGSELGETECYACGHRKREHGPNLECPESREEDCP